MLIAEDPLNEEEEAGVLLDQLIAGADRPFICNLILCCVQ